MVKLPGRSILYKYKSVLLYLVTVISNKRTRTKYNKIGVYYHFKMNFKKSEQVS